MAAATTRLLPDPARRAGASLLRADERALVISAGAVFALASAGAVVSAAAADAMFLTELGPAHLGEAMATSSALLAVVLAVVGGLADRLERRRVLATLAIVSGVVLVGLAALSVLAPRAAAVATLIGGKQLAAGTDLAFWIVMAERLDARRSRRVVPLLAAAGGVGAALGGILVIPLAAATGVRGVLVCGAGLLLLAGIGAMRLAATRRVTAPPAAIGALITRSWRDGARAARRHPLARHLALVVGLAGMFAALLYFALGVAVVAEGVAGADLVALLGGVRAIGQTLTLVVQLLIAPRLFARLGTGHVLLLAPLFAVAAGLGLVIAPILAVAIAAQISSRVLDGGVETPAEKLAQTLLPSAVRGRIGGFLDGTAKRAGAILGGLVAALLVGAPTAIYVVTAVAGALWLVAAARIARELPVLAVEHVAHDAEVEAVVDGRAIEMLVRELAGEQPARAAEVLARLHDRGRVDAVAPLVAAATGRGGRDLWGSLIAVLDAPSEVHGAALLAAARGGEPGVELELAIRAIGLAGGVSADDLAAWRTAGDGAIALTAELAAARLAGDADAVLAILADAVRDPGPTGRVAVDELGVEIARGLAAHRGGVSSGLSSGALIGGSISASVGGSVGGSVGRSVGGSVGGSSGGPVGGEARVLEAARHLVRALRRGRGDGAGRTAAFGWLARVIAASRDRRSAELSLLRADLLELARERVETGASPVAPEHMLTSLMRLPATTVDAAPEVAASLRLYGALLEGADSVEPEDLRRVARALGEPDDDVRAAAEDALTALGPAAAGELVATAAWGRRRARDRAAALLAELPVTPAALDRLIDAELDALEHTHAAIAVLVEPGDELLARRLEERLREIAHTVLLLVAARRRSPSIARAAAAWGHARGAVERARTLAVIEAALPRALVDRLVDAVDDLSAADRAGALARAGIEPASRDVVIRAELAGRDRLSRALALHTIGAAGRSAHRGTIASAAQAEARAASATDLLRRLTEAINASASASASASATTSVHHAARHAAVQAADQAAEGAQPTTRDEPSTEGVTDMPSRVESLIALGRVPLLAALTTRQLADVAERARWIHLRAGGVLVTAGDLLEALVVVDDGELALGERRFTKGDVVDELACVAPSAVADDLRATRPARLIRLERMDFEELVDDVPGLASAVCRALGERARRAEDGNYRSPLVSRAS